MHYFFHIRQPQDTILSQINPFYTLTLYSVFIIHFNIILRTIYLYSKITELSITQFSHPPGTFFLLVSNVF